MQEFLQQLINGLSIGSIYALIAVGYTMVYGILQLINFAHGDVFMVGALLTLTLSRKFGFFAPPHVTQSLPAFLLCATLAILCCAALGLVIYRFDIAALMGINIDLVISFTFVLGSALAGAAGVLYAIKYPSVNPLMGLLPGVKAFVAAVFGGIGNIAGAVCGALLLGLVEV